jgi:hypothetical protein
MQAPVAPNDVAQTAYAAPDRLRNKASGVHCIAIDAAARVTA